LETRKLLKFIEKYFNIFSKLSLVSGGAVFLFYCIQIKAFPDNLTVGDGIWLLFISAIYAMWTTLFYAYLMIQGLSIIILGRFIFRSRPISRLTNTYRHMRAVCSWPRKTNVTLKRPIKRQEKPKFNLVFPRVENVLHYLAGFGGIIIIMATLVKGQYLWLFKISLVSILFGLVYIMIISKRQQFAQLELIECEDKDQIRKNVRNVTTIFIVAALFVSTVLVGLFEISAKMTMNALGIRKENVTLYVRKPWSDILKQHDIEGSTSAFSGEFTRFEHMTVALSNFGSSVAIETGRRENLYSLKIPGDAILIDTLPDITQTKHKIHDTDGK
jgi:hypothetical protein